MAGENEANEVPVLSLRQHSERRSNSGLGSYSDPAPAMLRSSLRRFASTAPLKSPAGRSSVVWTYLPQQLPYALGLLLQETLVANRLSAKKLLAAPSELSPSQLERAQRTAETDVLLLLQHRPVYTAGRREKDLEVARLEGERLSALGADYVMTMRGGQTTYHGPGQLVGYPIFDLGAAEVRSFCLKEEHDEAKSSQLTTRCYVDHLERFLATLTTSLRVPVYDLPHTGVFTSPTAKIGSIGVHVRRRITLHGFSINIEQQALGWFANIVACGLDEVHATSVQTELRRLGVAQEGEGVKVEHVVGKAVEELGKEYGRVMEELGSQEEYAEIAKVIADGVAGKLPPLLAAASK